MGDSRESLWGIDATLVQDAVNAKGCGGKTEDSEVERQSVKSSQIEVHKGCVGSLSTRTSTVQGVHTPNSALVNFSRLEDLTPSNEAAAGPCPQTETNTTATPSDQVTQLHS